MNFLQWESLNNFASFDTQFWNCANFCTTVKIYTKYRTISILLIFDISIFNKTVFCKVFFEHFYLISVFCENFSIQTKIVTQWKSIRNISSFETHITNNWYGSVKKNILWKLEHVSLKVVKQVKISQYYVSLEIHIASYEHISMYSES